MSSILPRRLSLPVVQGALPAVRPLAPAVALRLLGEFQCTAGACEDTCCAGFTVAVDAVSHARLQVAYSHSAEDRARLRAALGPAPASADGSPESLTPHATLRLGADERCTLLSPAGLCSVQERHGEALLPDACSLFPRTTVLVGERLEVGATLACPEVARLVLGAEGALDQVDLPGGEDEVLPRALVGRTIDESDDAWTAAFAEVRATLLHLVRDAARPLPERLASMADLAERVRPFHFRGSPELAGASRVFAERRLARALALAADPLHADGVARDLAALDLPGEETLALAASMLLERRCSPRTAAAAKRSTRPMARSSTSSSPASGSTSSCAGRSPTRARSCSTSCGSACASRPCGCSSSRTLPSPRWPIRTIGRLRPRAPCAPRWPRSRRPSRAPSSTTCSSSAPPKSPSRAKPRWAARCCLRPSKATARALRCGYNAVMQKRRRKLADLTIRLDESDRRAIEAAARADHLPASTWLRQAALRLAEEKKAAKARRERLATLAERLQKLPRFVRGAEE